MTFWILAALVAALPLILILRPSVMGRGADKRVVVGLLGVFTLAPVGLYLWLGQPGLPGQPFADRLAQINAADPEGLSLQALRHRIAVHLRSNPGDGEGWQHLAMLDLMLGAPQESAQALGRAIDVFGERPDLLSRMGEALTLANNGLVSEEARRYLEQAWRENPQDARAGFLLALADEQSGNVPAAIERLEALQGVASSQDPRVAMAIGQKLAALDPDRSAAAPQPDAEARRAIQSMDPASQAEAIKGMVAGLEARLRADGGGVAEWLRLARSLEVLGDADKAEWALEQARAAADGQPEALAQVDAFLKARQSQ